MNSLYTKMVLLIKTILFYVGSILALVLFSCMAVLIVPFMNGHKRQYLLTRYNVFVLWLSKFTCGVRYKVEGLENIQKGPYIILCNHQSSLETFLLQTLFSPLSTVLKQELLRVPFFGWGAKMLKAIPLDRRRPAQAYRQLISQGKDRVLENRSVLIFPEGTRVPMGAKVKFNRGGAALAHHTKAPIIPVAHNAGLRWSFKNLMLSPGTITVRIGKPINSTDKSKSELYETSTHWIESNRDELMMLVLS